MGGEREREGGGQDGVELGGEWDNCNSIINKYIKKKHKKKVSHILDIFFGYLISHILIFSL